MTNFDQNTEKKKFTPKIEAGHVLIDVLIFFWDFSLDVLIKGVLIK